MKRIAIVLVLFAVSVSGSATAKPAVKVATVRPDWVRTEIDRFERSYERYDQLGVDDAFVVQFAWGRGTYDGKAVNWYAFSNTDAGMFIELSSTLSLDDSKRIILIGEVSEVERDWQTNNGFGGGTVIETSDWPKFCGVYFDTSKCDAKKAIRRALGLVNGRLQGRLHLRVVEYLK